MFNTCLCRAKKPPFRLEIGVQVLDNVCASHMHTDSVCRTEVHSSELCTGPTCAKHEHTSDERKRGIWNIPVNRYDSPVGGA